MHIWWYSVVSSPLADTQLYSQVGTQPLTSVAAEHKQQQQNNELQGQLSTHFSSIGILNI